MFADITKPAPPLPAAQVIQIEPGLSLLPPLSRRGSGPGMIILVPATEKSYSIVDGVPCQMVKWAEEGYTVVEIQCFAIQNDKDIITKAINAFETCDKFEPQGNIGLIAWDPQLWNSVASKVIATPSISGVVVYGNTSDPPNVPSISTPFLFHLCGSAPEVQSEMNAGKIFYYPDLKSYKFATPFGEEFSYWHESISHTRSLTFLKPLMNGPFFDLETIWDEHTWYEFNDRSVEHTMSTMVEQPYVNHVPTLTGGIGRASLSQFYRNNFIYNNSADTELELISRTIGIDRVVDEFILKFTHDQQLDWLLPGVPPTYKKAEVPFVAVVNIRGDRLYHEHISWDQGTVLAQLGLMPQFLPYPYLINGKEPNANSQFEYRVPIGGIETTQKMRDRNSVLSNEMFSFAAREVPKSD